MNNNLPQKSGNNSITETNSLKNLMTARNSALNPMDYNVRITRNNPGSIVVLLDQSGSMSNEYRGKTKAEAVADVVNDLLNDLVSKCQREGYVRDYCQVLIIGYGQKQEGSSHKPVFCWEGNLKGKDWVKVSELKNNVLESIVNEKQEEMPWGEVIKSTITKNIWIKAIADGLTPMKAALELCYDKIEDWVCDFPDSYPPLVFNITDGYPTDVKHNDELMDVCNRIKSIRTNHGNVLLFNSLYTADGTMTRLPLIDQAIDFEDDYHKTLFESSSLLPSKMKQKAYEKYGNEDFLNKNPVGVIINADVKSIADLLNFGTNTLIDAFE
ncbi:MAG: hypothetical protein ACI7YS_11275 [Flavobacterium sp.]